MFSTSHAHIPEEIIEQAQLFASEEFPDGPQSARNAFVAGYLAGFQQIMYRDENKENINPSGQLVQAPPRGSNGQR